MKKNFSIHVPTPCTEKWQGISRTSEGGFCNTCNKSVVDFTEKTDDEISDYFTRTTAKTCGRFRPDQLKLYSSRPPFKVSPGFKLFRAGILGLLLLLLSKPVFSQIEQPKPTTELTDGRKSQKNESVTQEGITVKGIVKSDFDDELLAGANIYLKGSQVGTVADVNGHFEFPQKLFPGDVLVVSFIGCVSKEFKVPKDADETMMIPLMLYTDIMGEVTVNTMYEQKSNWWLKVKELF